MRTIRDNWMTIASACEWMVFIATNLAKLRLSLPLRAIIESELFLQSSTCSPIFSVRPSRRINSAGFGAMVSARIASIAFVVIPNSNELTGILVEVFEQMVSHESTTSITPVHHRSLLCRYCLFHALFCSLVHSQPHIHSIIRQHMQFPCCFKKILLTGEWPGSCSCSGSDPTCFTTFQGYMAH